MLKPWKRNTIATSQTSTAITTPNTQLNSFTDLDSNLAKQLHAQLKPKGLEKDEVLYAAGSPIDTLYWVTKGCIISHDLSLTFTPGDWITDTALRSADVHQYQLIATAPSALLTLDLNKLNQLSPSLQNYLQDVLFRQLKDRHVTSVAKTKKLLIQNSKLKKALYLAHTQHTDAFIQSTTAKQVLAKVPRIPISSMQLLNKLLDSNSSQNEIVALINQDPSLTSTLLKAINSSSYGLERKISDINHAISLLGFDNVYQIVISESLRHSLPETEFFHSTHILSLEISHCIFVLAQISQRAKPTEMATLGLMSQIGEVVVELLKIQSPRLSSLFAQVDAAALGGALLKSWSLPATLYEALAFKNHPEFTEPNTLPDTIKTPVALLFTAKICRACLYEEDISSQELYLDEYLSLLGFSNLSINTINTQYLLPALRRRKIGLPVTLRKQIENFSQQ